MTENSSKDKDVEMKDEQAKKEPESKKESEPTD
jgi:hypothetical protein